MPNVTIINTNFWKKNEWLRYVMNEITNQITPNWESRVIWWSSAREETRDTPEWTPNINIYKLFFKCQIMNESRKNVRRSFGCTKEAFRNATSNLEPGSCSVNVIDFQQSAKRCTLCKMYLETLGNN